MILERCPSFQSDAAVILGACITRKMEDLALAVLSKLKEIHGHEPYGIAFEWNPFEHTGGGYAPKNDVLFINLVHLRTFRDVVYVLSHEYCHLLQQRKHGADSMAASAMNVNKMLAQHDAEARFYAYLLTDIEQEADAFAFDFEASFDYKNEVVNRRPKVSFFVSRKHSIAFAPK